MSSKQVLIEKIERFIRKYYLNRLVQGVLVGAALWIVFYLLVNALEYFSWFSSKVRLVLFILLLLGSAFVLVYWFLVPLWNLIRFRKRMSHEQAALMIGRFFPDIEDKLLNTLQLADAAESDQDNALLLASIEQRTQRLTPVRFTDAVDLRGNLRYLWVFLGLAALLVGLICFLPRFAVQPTQRIFHYNEAFEKPLPFEVTLSQKAFEANQGTDLPFSIHVTGSRIPDAFYVKSPLGQQLLNQESVNEFNYVFRNLNQDFSFQVLGGEYCSQPIPVTVHPNPVLLSYRCLVTYPAYIHRAPESFEGKTRLLVPQGARLAFFYSLRDCDSAWVQVDSLTKALPLHDGEATFQLTAASSLAFDLVARNAWSSQFDPLRFAVDVVPDAYPDIRVESFDEALSNEIYYSGLLADDYGLTKLVFHGTVKQPVERTMTVPIVFDKSQPRTSFFHRIHLDSLGVLPGQELEVCFEVWDNDGFHGPKSKRSATFSYYKASQAMLDSVATQTENEIMDRMAEHSQEASKLKDDLEKMLRELAAKKELDWSDKEKIKDLVQQQAQLEEEWNKLQDEQRQLSDFMKENNLANEELLKKQQQINDLFEELIPDELKKMMEEIERLLDEMPRDKMQELLQDMKNDNQKMQDLLDRNLALLEQLRMEKDLNDLAEKLKELGEALQEEQSKSAEEAQREFDDLMKTFDSLQQKNQQLTDPFQLQKDEALQDSIEQDLEQAAAQEQQEQQESSQEQPVSTDQSDPSECQDGDSSSDDEQSGAQPSGSSSQSKKNAGKKMQQMANSMMMQMQSGADEQLAEDAHLVRILLENTVRASHQQEDLMQSVGRMRNDDPSLSEKIVQQKALSDNFAMVEDSLKAMALRQPAIKSFIFNELDVIDRQTEVALKYMNDLRLSVAVGNQQVALQSMNNLALMLAESLKEMESSMSGSGTSQKKSKPSKGQQGQSMQNMKQLQEQLGEQLKQLQQQMQNKQGQAMSKQLAEELARMAAEQEMLREGMQQMLNEMKKNGQLGDDGLNQIIKDMERLEEDIVNKRITNQTLERNREIVSRMLESEKAQQKRDQDERRKSNEYKGSKFERQVDPLYYEQRLKKSQEFLKQQPIQYQPYFKSKINEYYLKKNSH
ncbi:MAG: hypothetical protein J5831_00560 [Bacteroidales bacterium]|nr:hypothetical protein [Bacteroidales bacterium]